MKTTRLTIILVFISIVTSVFSQSVVMTDDAAYTTGHASSVLDVKSTSKGLLIPRLTQSQRNSISNPSNGLMIYQTDNTPGFYYFNSSTWTSIGGSSSANGSETLVTAGTSITVTGTGTSVNPYVVSFQNQSVTTAQRNALTGLYAGRIVWCSDCGSGQLQIYNGSWTNMVGTSAFPPAVTTASVTNIKGTTATCGGTVTSNGGETLLAEGVCWNTSTNPTIANSKTTDGTGTPYISYLTGLSPNTTYYVRAYATNSTGTVYGSVNSFTTTGLALGDPWQGGIIGYIFVSGDAGYVSGQTHGIVAATSDQSTGVVWGCYGTDLGGYNTAERTAIGGGWENTNEILSYSCNGAAEVCISYSSGGYSGWFLPSKDELLKLYLNRVVIGGFSTTSLYWSSSEHHGDEIDDAEARRFYSWYVNFSNGNSGLLTKDQTYRVRPIRYF